MSNRGAVLARIRPAAGPLLLAVFLAAAQLAPLTHLATHRNDHSHGPEDGGNGDRHRHGQAAAPVGRLATLADALARHGRRLPPVAPAPDDEHPTTGSGVAHRHADSPVGHDREPQAPSPRHGQGSLAHLGLALLAGPPPTFLPPPPDTLASPPDDVVRSHVAPPRRQPRARGPPHLG